MPGATGMSASVSMNGLSVAMPLRLEGTPLRTDAGKLNRVLQFQQAGGGIHQVAREIS